MKRLFLASACLILLPFLATAQVSDDSSTCLSADCEPGIDAMIEQQFQDSFDSTYGQFEYDMDGGGYGEGAHGEGDPPQNLKQCMSHCIVEADIAYKKCGSMRGGDLCLSVRKLHFEQCYIEHRCHNFPAQGATSG